MTLRYYTKFSSLDLSDEFVFPLSLYECSFRQPLRVANALVVGKSYGIRLTGGGAVLKDFGSVTVRFQIQSDSVREEMNDKLYNFGLGYLHTNDGKKARAEISSMPEIEISYSKPGIAPIVLTFIVHEDFA